MKPRIEEPLAPCVSPIVLSKWDSNKDGRLDGDEIAPMQRDKIKVRQEQQEVRHKATIEARDLDEAARRTPARPTQP